jgi:hypothetical protein
MPNPFLTAPWNWNPRNPTQMPQLPGMPERGQAPAAGTPPPFMTASRMDMTGLNPTLPNLPAPPKFPMPPAPTEQTELPGIWPIPPKQNANFGPTLPTPTPDELGGSPNGYGEFPYAYDPAETVPGRMTYNGPQLNTQGALAGLQRLQSSQDPILQRIANAYDIRKGGDTRSNILGASIMNDVDQSLAPQRLRTEKTWNSIYEHHPAYQEAEEAEAVRRTYPSVATAKGNELAATIGAQGRLGAAELTRDGNYARAGATKMQGALRGLVDAMQPRQGDTDESRAERLKFWLGIMNQLQGGAGIDDESFINDVDDDF